MKLNLRPVIAGAAALVITGGVLATTVGTAAAATTPPWEPDPNALGSLTLFNAAGTAITGGSDLTHLFDYAEASTADTLGGTKATLVFANPQPSTPTGSFPTGQGSTSVTFPNASAPAPVNGFTNPVATSGATGANLTNFIASEVPNTAAGFANVFQIRLVTSAPGGGGSTDTAQYWEDDIQVNPSAGTWSVIFPASKTNTTTTLVAAPNPGTVGQTETLTATEAPAVAGSVQFMDGATNIGSAVAVNGSGVATATTSSLTVGSHNLSSVFTPTDAADNNGSTGTTTLVINPAATPTKTALVVNQDGNAGDDVGLSATVTSGGGPVTAGTVSFFDNNSATPLNATPVTPNASGVAAFDIPAGLPAGGHSIVAKFTPTSVTAFEASQSAPQSFVLVTAGGACAQAGSACTDKQFIQATIPVGTLVISTPYTQAQPLDLGTLTLDGTAGQYSASATFHDILVTDTRSGGLGWTATALGTPLSDGGSNPGSTISPENLGLTQLTETPSAGDTAVIAVQDNPAANPAVAPTDTGSQGLGGTTPHTFATSTVGAGQSGDGTVTMDGTLTLNAPTSTEAGLFQGTITFTVG